MSYSRKLVVLVLSLFLVSIMGAGCSKGDGYIVGVTTGTTYQEVAESYDNVKEVKTLKNDNYTLKELTDERVDAVISDRLLALHAIKEGGFDQLETVGDVIYNETIGVAIRKEDDALRQAINNVLAEMIEDGTYEEISKKYFNKNILDGFEYKKTFLEEEAATDDSLQRVLDAGEITFAMSGGYRPFNYFTEEDELVGFDVEIGKEVANRLGVTYKPITTDWSGILEGLRSGRYDGIFGSMAITPERLEQVDFTDPYYYSGAQLIVKKGSDIKGPEDLGERKSEE